MNWKPIVPIKPNVDAELVKMSAKGKVVGVENTVKLKVIVITAGAKAALQRRLCKTKVGK